MAEDKGFIFQGSSNYEGHGLVGDVRGDRNMGYARIDEYIKKQAALMEEYAIDRVDLSWSLQALKAKLKNGG